MKDIKEKINESAGIELLTMSACILSAIVSTGVTLGVHATVFNGENPFKLMWDDIKGFFKDKKLQKIANKLKDDPEVQEYAKDPNKSGWRKMLETKLDKDDIQYINSLTRKYFLQ